MVLTKVATSLADGGNGSVGQDAARAAPTERRPTRDTDSSIEGAWTIESLVLRHIYGRIEGLARVGCRTAHSSQLRIDETSNTPMHRVESGLSAIQNTLRGPPSNTGCSRREMTQGRLITTTGPSAGSAATDTQGQRTLRFTS